LTLLHHFFDLTKSHELTIEHAASLHTLFDIGIPLNLKIYLSCSIFQEDYGIDGCSSEDRRSWTTKMIDFCKSCIDPTRPMGEDASSEGYATPRSLETPVQMASKCPSLNQIRDPYASRHPNSLRLTEEEKRQRLLKFTKPLKKEFDSLKHHADCGVGGAGVNGNGNGGGSCSAGGAGGPNADSIYTILIKLPPPSKALSTGEKPSVSSQKAAAYSTSIQQLPSMAAGSCGSFGALTSHEPVALGTVHILRKNF
jgi:hypothetical protein